MLELWLADTVTSKIYSAAESKKALRKMLNKVWDEGRSYGWFRAAHPGYYARTKSAILGRRYRDVTKVIKEAFPDPPKEEKQNG